MNKLPVRCGLWAFLGLVAISFGLSGPSRTAAAAATIAAQPPVVFTVPGTWYDSTVDVNGEVLAQGIDTCIPVTDTSKLREGWNVKISNEQMLIQDLADPNCAPGEMRVLRAQNGTPCLAHSQGEPVETHAVVVNIWANGVTDPAGYGLGLFKVDLTFPPEVEMIAMWPDPQWLGSTGRIPFCYGAWQKGPSTWEVSCGSENNPPIGDDITWHPPGPTGSGRIAQLLVVPPAKQAGAVTIGLAGSTLTNVAVTNLGATNVDLVMRTVDCPDANRDGKMSVGDLYTVAISSGEKGRDTNVTLSSAMNASATSAQISDQSLLHVNDTVSIDAELMTVGSLHEGTPDTMGVTRAFFSTPAKSHKAGAHIYRGYYDGNNDGLLTYTRPADIDGSGIINVGDLYVVASVPSGTLCPAP